MSAASKQTMTPAEARSWARAQAAQEHLRALARLAAPIELMPLKGIELVFRYGVAATERSMLDFDVLVSPGRFDQVVSMAEGAAYRMVKSNYSTKVMLAPNGFVLVDIHRMPLPPMLGRWGARQLFRGGERESDVFGAGLVHAAPADFFVLLLANCLKDQLPDDRAESMLRDLAAVASQTTPEAVLVAATEARLSLAGWLVLTWLERSVDGFSLGAFRRVLEPSRRDRWRGELSLSLLPRWRSEHSEVAYALARSNADELWRGVMSAGLSLARAGRDWLQAQRSGSV